MYLQAWVNRTGPREPSDSKIEIGAWLHEYCEKVGDKLPDGSVHNVPGSYVAV